MGEAITFWPLAEAGLLVRLGEAISAPLSRRIAALTDALETARLPGIVDLVPSYTTLTILLDPAMADVPVIEDAVRQCWANAAMTDGPAMGRRIEIPVVYGGEFGPDLDEVARHTGLPADEVIRRHSEATYLVGALGFAPGFAYLIGLPAELATPRRATPRREVPPGSVGIGGGQTGVYSLPTPGGWQLVGRTEATLFDPRLIEEASDSPFPLRMGDEVRFVPVEALTPAVKSTTSGRRDTNRDGVAHVVIVDPGLQTTVQDTGRPGYGRLGIPPGGAADRGALQRANWLVGNDDDAAVLEIALVGPRLRFAGLDGERLIAVTGAELAATLNGRRLPLATAVAARRGDEVRFGARMWGARAYLAVRGGFDLPLVLGSRSTDLTAGFGGLDGRALRAGDHLPLGEPRQETGTVSLPRRSRPNGAMHLRAIRFVAGPQADRLSLPALCNADWRVSASSNRVGIRLDGPGLKGVGGTDIISEGMTTGGIQITNEGRPIVMLPARATIGGYARIGTVIGADLDRLAQLAPGDAVRFREVSVAEARILTLADSDEAVEAASSVAGLELAIGLVEHMVRNEALGELRVEVASTWFRLRAARPADRRET